MKSFNNLPPENLDHLVYTASSLEVGMNEIESILGVRPVPGGSHPDFGTQNALLSLGTSTYLEVIAPDPNTSLPNQDILFNEYFNQRPQLARWVVQTEQIEKITARALSSGLNLGSVQNGSRKKPDGSIIAWQITDPWVIPLEGAVPFLINWDDTPHPAASAASAGELVGFVLEHPNPVQVRDALTLLGLNIKIKQSEKFRLVATVETPNGLREIF